MGKIGSIEPAGDKVNVTAGLMTPESLAELMGGPDIEPVQSTLQTPPGPPNAYDEYPVLPPIGLPAQVPIPPPPVPGVVLDPARSLARSRAGARGPVGAPLPAEAGAGQ